MKNCPHCGGELNGTKRKMNGSRTTNPYNHPFPHAKLYNVSLTPRLIPKQNWSPRLIENNDPRCWPISGKAPDVAIQPPYTDTEVTIKIVR